MSQLSQLGWSLALTDKASQSIGIARQTRVNSQPFQVDQVVKESLRQNGYIISLQFPVKTSSSFIWQLIYSNFLRVDFFKVVYSFEKQTALIIFCFSNSTSTNRDKLVFNHSHYRLIKLSNSPSGRKATSIFGSIPWNHRLIRINFSISWFIQFFPVAGYSSEKVSVPIFFLNPSYCFFRCCCCCCFYFLVWQR